MPVEDLIREHRKFGKRLDSIGFTVSSKGRQIIVKFGKKLNIIECPTIDAAQSLADGFNSTIQSRAAQINEFITLMEANVQQLSLFAPPKPKFVCKGINMCDFIGEEYLCPEVGCVRKDKPVAEPIVTDDAPVPTENPFEGIEEQEVPDHHQS